MCAEDGKECRFVYEPALDDFIDAICHLSDAFNVKDQRHGENLAFPGDEGYLLFS